MPSQYTVEMNLNAYKAKPINIELLKSTLHNVANGLKEGGWCAQKTETDDKICLMFWADKQLVEKILEEHTVKFNQGFNGIILYFTEKLLGSKSKHLVIEKAKISIREKIEKALENSIENDLSSLQNIAGFSLMKNDKPLFISETNNQIVNSKKIKP